MGQTSKFRAWLVWILAASFFFAEYFARVAPSVMVPDLMRAFHVNALSLGALSAFFYYAYVGMQLPVGALIDRFGPHKLLTLTAMLCGGACFLFAYAQALAIADLARFLMGLAAAFAFVGALQLARTWFSPARFGLLAGATQALGMLGAAVGEGPVAVLVQRWGWRLTMSGIGFFLLVLALLIALIVRDKPTTFDEKMQIKTSVTYSLWQSLVAVVKTPQCWVNGIFVGFLYAPTAAFAELWGASYLHRIYDLSPTEAASMVGAIFLGFALSSPCAGWLSDKIGKRKPIMLASILFSCFFMSAVLYWPGLSVTAVVILLWLYGMSNVAVALSYVVASEIVPSGISATSMSFANMFSVIVGAFFQPLIGWLLVKGWDHQISHGVPIYSADDYRWAMLSLPLCYGLSLLAWLFLKESYVKSSVA